MTNLMTPTEQDTPFSKDCGKLACYIGAIHRHEGNRAVFQDPKIQKEWYAFGEPDDSSEQDKELHSKSYKLAQEYLSTDSLDGFVDLIQNNLTLDEAVQLITADRKRVALEAELQLLTYLLDERTEHMFMQNPDTGEMTGNGWLCNTSLSAVSANRIEAERRKRIAELKAQQEEV